MATVEVTDELEPRAPAIGWDGRRLDEMLAESERLCADTSPPRILENSFS